MRIAGGADARTFTQRAKAGCVARLAAAAVPA